VTHPVKSLEAKAPIPLIEDYHKHFVPWLYLGVSSSDNSPWFSSKWQL